MHARSLKLILVVPNDVARAKISILLPVYWIVSGGWCVYRCACVIILACVCVYMIGE